MQDRFKYRFFDVENKKMYDVKNICFVGEPTVTVAYKPVIKKAIYRGYLIQCTGLKDKNGKLIYEGDIVKYMYYNPKRYTKWAVAFDQNTLEFGLKDYRYGGYLRITSHSILNNKVEVIGNIFQNPELLSEVE